MIVLVLVLVVGLVVLVVWVGSNWGGGGCESVG